VARLLVIDPRFMTINNRYKADQNGCHFRSQSIKRVQNLSDENYDKLYISQIYADSFYLYLRGLEDRFLFFLDHLAVDDVIKTSRAPCQMLIFSWAAGMCSTSHRHGFISLDLSAVLSPPLFAVPFFGISTPTPELFANNRRTWR